MTYYINLADLIAASIVLSESAGEIIVKVSSSGSSLQAIDKSTHATEQTTDNAAAAVLDDPQTIADRRAQQMIVQSLKELWGGFGLTIVGEEGELERDEDLIDFELENKIKEKKKEYPVLLNDFPDSLSTIDIARVCFWVDPLDATREFTKGLLEYVTVLIGITVDGNPTAGIIHGPYVNHPHVPRKRETTFGCVGVGVVFPGSTEPTTRLKRMHSSMENNRCVAVVSLARSDEIIDAALNQIQPTDVIRGGGAGYKINKLLFGEADIYVFTKSGTSRWDSCAGEALLVSLGGKVVDKYGNKYEYKKQYKNPDYLNYSGLLAAVDADLLSKIIKDISIMEVIKDKNGKYFNAKMLNDLLNPNSENLIKTFHGEELDTKGLHSQTVQINLRFNNDDKKSVVLKRIVCTDLPSRTLKKWERDVQSYATEAFFYQHFAIDMLHAGIPLPNCLYVLNDDKRKDCNGDENESELRDGCVNSKFMMFFDSLRSSHEHILCLRENELKSALKTIAKFHSYTFKNKSKMDLATSKMWRRGCYWRYDKRPKEELEQLESLWGKIVDKMKTVNGEFNTFFTSLKGRNLGNKMKSIALSVDEQIKAEEEKGFLTLLHGDFKTANIFFPKKGAGQTDSFPIPIDFQWSGLGLPAMDVSYLLLSSSMPGLFDESTTTTTTATTTTIGKITEKELTLIKEYFSFFSSITDATLMNEYTFESFLYQYKLSCLDYIRVVISYQWKAISTGGKEWLENRKDNINSCVHNRSVKAFFWLCQRCQWLIEDLQL